jgi:hypothetical protein
MTERWVRLVREECLDHILILEVSSMNITDILPLRFRVMNRVIAPFKVLFNVGLLI